MAAMTSFYVCPPLAAACVRRLSASPPSECDVSS